MNHTDQKSQSNRGRNYPANGFVASFISNNSMIEEIIADIRKRWQEKVFRKKILAYKEKFLNEQREERNQI